MICTQTGELTLVYLKYMYNYFINSYLGYLMYFLLVPYIIFRWLSFLSSVRAGQIIWFLLGIAYVLFLFDYKVDFNYIFRPLSIFVVWRILTKYGKVENLTSSSLASSYCGFGIIIGLIYELILFTV